MVSKAGWTRFCAGHFRNEKALVEVKSGSSMSSNSCKVMSSRSSEEHYGPGLKENRTCFVQDVLNGVLWEPAMVSKGGQEAPCHCQGYPEV